MSRTSPGFEISRPTGRCFITQRDLAPGEPIVVALVEREPDPEGNPTEGFERLDFSGEGWDSLPDDTRGGGRKHLPDRRIFAWWRASQPEPGARPLIALDDNGLLDLFEELGYADDPETDAQRASRLAFRFVLTLILARKRLVRLERSGTEGLFVRPRGTPPEAESVFVEDPGLTPERLREVMDRLGAILRGDE
jgi:hypothetical protein